MKSYVLNFKTNNLIIPIAYHHQVQSMIYNILKNGCLNSLHDRIVDEDKRNFKFFCFSLLSGGILCKENNYLKFKDLLTIEIRSISDEFCQAFEQGLQKEIYLFQQQLYILDYKVEFIPFCKDEQIVQFDIEMLSPISCYITNNDFTFYLDPHNDSFANEINNNFKRKYYAFNNVVIEEDITLIPVSNIKKYITKYKNTNERITKPIYLSGYLGKYKLIGKYKYLKFLYYTGLGSHNSSGFGMFKIKKINELSNLKN